MAGLAEFETRIQQLAAYADCLPVMILESTGPYHALVARFLEDHGKLSQDKLTRIFLGQESPPRAHQSRQGNLVWEAVGGILVGEGGSMP
jgi:hypothetical protein